jgi:hypothetical protein
MTAAKRARQKAGRAAGGRHTHAVHQKAPGEHGKLVNVRCPVCRPLPMDGEARELARRR